MNFEMKVKWLLVLLNFSVQPWTRMKKNACNGWRSLWCATRILSAWNTTAFKVVCSYMHPLKMRVVTGFFPLHWPDGDLMEWVYLQAGSDQRDRKINSLRNFMNCLFGISLVRLASENMSLDSDVESCLGLMAHKKTNFHCSCLLWEQ